APAIYMRCVDAPGRFRRQAVLLCIGRLVVLQTGDPSMQQQWSDLYATRHEPNQQLWCKCAAGRGHLGAPWLRGIDSLVVARGPALPHVVVANGESVTLQIRKE